jgi:hypothetical protein
MARIGISITKSVVFRNSVQEFSNVYYYDGLSWAPNEADATNLIDELVVKEKQIHATNVTFVRGRLWTQTGDQSTNNMIAQKNLSGTGSLTPTGNMDKERAYLFQLRAGVDNRGNPVKLRKWFHAGGAIGGVALDQTKLENTAGFTVANRDAIRAALPAIGACGSGATAGVLCAKSGRLPTAGEVWQPHQFLEHHQLGDMWRAQ